MYPGVTVTEHHSGAAAARCAAVGRRGSVVLVGAGIPDGVAGALVEVKQQLRVGVALQRVRSTYARLPVRYL